MSNYKHGHTCMRVHTPEYNAWACMVERCSNKNHKLWDKYGGRGIRVYRGWIGHFEAFLEDMGRRRNGYVLCRDNINKDYSPENCRWGSPKTLANNRSNSRYIEFDGLRRTAYEWANLTGIEAGTIKSRIRRGWSVKDAIEACDGDYADKTGALT